MKTLSKIVQWIFSFLFFLCALGNGWHWSSIFLVLAAVLLMPITALRNVLKVKTWLIVIAAVILFFVAMFNLPMVAVGGMDYDDTVPPIVTDTTLRTTTTVATAATTTETVAETTGESLLTTAATQTTTAATSVTTADSQTTTPTTVMTTTTRTSTTTSKVTTQKTTQKTTRTQSNSQRVWIPASGRGKYHSTPDCSNMKNPIELSKSEAIASNHDACGKCW